MAETPRGDWPPPTPDESVVIIGDIHGCAVKLQNLLSRVDALPDLPAKLVFVGDYIDRGDGSDTVLRFVFNLSRQQPDRVICLSGNHERMLLDFLQDPTGRPRRWLRHGGLQTLASFGIRLPGERGNPPAALLDAAGDLREAMGPELVDWLEALPLSWRSGNLWVTHAGADPDLPMAAQTDHTLIWGCKGFQARPRTDGQWVAFGHTPFDKAFARHGRIAVDTGAAYGGPLSAALVSPNGDISFVSS